ncbi:uncharacterized protein LOC129325660 [Eublepharis macularius]|uniref:Gypsy retrotransposon integrase-like protein 1 n=1 Tax=Eublepharis macularius TaxID=481883 RepID=A0AA97KT56_EUBMA|nr:uncharacterized protein LOC129325660 [Eublepharis macularius]
MAAGGKNTNPFRGPVDESLYTIASVGEPDDREEDLQTTPPVRPKTRATEQSTPADLQPWQDDQRTDDRPVPPPRAKIQFTTPVDYLEDAVPSKSRSRHFAGTKGQAILEDESRSDSETELENEFWRRRRRRPNVNLWSEEDVEERAASPRDRTRQDVSLPRPSRRRMPDVHFWSADDEEEEEFTRPRRPADRDISPVRPARPPPLSPWAFDRRLFPTFKDGQDPLGFFSLYEQTCKDLGVPNRYYMLILRSQVTGVLADLLGNLPAQAAGSYPQFKTLALQRFALSSENYRRAFRRVERSQENYYLTAAKLSQNLDRWLAAEGVHSFLQLKELMLKEQFYRVLPEDLTALVQDWDPQTLEQAAELAQKMKLHRQRFGGKPAVGSGGTIRPAAEVSKPAKASETGSASSEKKITSPTVAVRPRLEPRSGLCFYCKEKGHNVVDCPVLKAKGQKKTSTPASTTRVRTVQAAPAASQPENWEDDATVPVQQAATAVQPAQPTQPPSAPVTASVSAAAPSASQPVAMSFIDPQQINWAQMEFSHELRINFVQVSGLRDSGSDVSSVQRQLVQPDQFLQGKTLTVTPYSSQPIQKELANVHVEYKFYNGSLTVLVHDTATPAFLIGNDLAYKSFCCMPAELKQQQKPELCEVSVSAQPVAVATAPPSADRPACPEPSDSAVVNSQVFADEQLFIQAQKADVSLKSCWEAVEKSPRCFGQPRVKFLVENGLLYREYVAKKLDTPIKQLVVPQPFREKVLQLAHENLLSGHFGVKRTLEKVSRSFYWPEVCQAVTAFVKTCDVCQREGFSADHPRAPLQPAPIVEEVFAKWGIDIIGPLAKPSRSGKKFLLTVIDFSSHYLDVTPLANITAPAVARALLVVASRWGLPKTIRSDMGPSLVSGLMKKVFELAKIEHQVTIPYAHWENGLTERVNRTVGQMLRKYVLDFGPDWEKSLPFMIGAYNDTLQESLGFSPNQIVFGRSLNTPLTMLRQQWEGVSELKPMSVVTYFHQLKETLAAIWESAKLHLTKAQTLQKRAYDRKAVPREYFPKDKVLVLSLVKPHKMAVMWTGPAEIVKKESAVHYLVAFPEAHPQPKLYHVNSLEKYHERLPGMFALKCTEDVPDQPLDLLAESKDPGGIDSIIFDSALSSEQTAQLYAVLEKFADVFTSRPGRTSLLTHTINTQDALPVASHPYRVSGQHAKDIALEIQEMLDLNVIKPSQSAWAAPVVLVPKKDGGIRFCVDYRKLNAVTVSDQFPLPRIDELIERLGRAKYISVLDMNKGYWQVCLDEDASVKSAFVTHLGLYQFITMPFGLKNASMTFQRLINTMLQGLSEYSCAYLDDVAIFSDTWSDHMYHLSQVLTRVRDVGLTIKVSKCQFALAEVSYLGHRVGGGTIKPLEAKVQSILDWPVPKTKREVQSFLGLIGYYRRFINHFSTLATPLTDLCKKRQPLKVVWTAQCQSAFESLKACLMQSPVMIAPDPAQPFFVQTDASQTGVGAVLCQKGPDGTLHPVVFLSKKLLPRECNLSTIEKECFGIVWALTKLRSYLWGQKFTLQTDHSPLCWLDRVKNSNQKLLRWSLALQDFDFTVQHIKGSENIVADRLSRIYCDVAG